MDKKGGLLGFFFVLGLAWILLFWYYKIYTPQENERLLFCAENKLSEDCNKECVLSCHRLGKDYFKYEFNSGGLFSSSEENCFCVEDNEVTQVY